MRLNRKLNSTKEGKDWGQETIKKVFDKGKVIDVDTLPKSVWRYDKCGDPIKFSEFGNRDSKHGWEIDHINPVVNGGSDELENLQPLHWKNNLDKNDQLYWECN